ncbi:hypothetical protein B0H19DRAFT_1078033 [Mycena capillaripes]|nr:hypothetical protein B0H19DRAFT_1085898 [Mycena capillaripes]KAJ6540632.1 hypothetical protein B0H19DRAFT_1078033 [Mycena capillaripes]
MFFHHPNDLLRYISATICWLKDASDGGLPLDSRWRSKQRKTYRYRILGFRGIFVVVITPFSKSIHFVCSAGFANSSVSGSIGEDGELWNRRQAKPQLHRLSPLQTLKYLLTMLESYYGIEPSEERFTVIDYGEEFEVTDWQTPAEPFLVTRNELDEPSWDIPSMLEKIGTVNSTRTEQKVTTAFPFMGEANSDYPALNWLRIKLAFAMDSRPWARITPEDRLSVDRHARGYKIKILGTEISFVITHTQIKDPDLDLGRILDEEWEDLEILNAQQDESLGIPARPFEPWTPGRDVVGLFPFQPESPPRRRNCSRLKPREPNQVTVGLCAANPEPPAKRSINHRKTAKKGPSYQDRIEAIERNAMVPRDFRRCLPKPVIIQVMVNNKPVRALLDTGSMADFISTTLVDRLALKKDVLAKPITVQLAVHGSRSKINASTTVKFKYQDINCERRFDIANLDSYDLILGTPFIFQHKIVVGMNPTRVVVGSPEPLKHRKSGLLTG